MPSQPSPCASSNTASRQEIILFSFVQGAGLTPCAKYIPVSLLLSPGESGYRKLPLECSHFEEALTLEEESLSTTAECETCALIRPERAQSKLPQNQAFVRTRSHCRHRNSFDFAARLVCGVRTVHPVSRVFRSAFHVG